MFADSWALCISFFRLRVEPFYDTSIARRLLSAQPASRCALWLPKAWSVLQSLREILQAAGVIIPPPAQKTFATEGKFLERAFKQALSEREEALGVSSKPLVGLIDRLSVKGADFGQAHQALLTALEQSGKFV